MIEGFHSNWTAPFFKRNKNSNYYIEDFEILTTILSALKWRQHNGSIKMITDTIGAEYYKNIGIESIWDLGIDVKLDNIPHDINPDIFWAAGKIYALESQNNSSIAMIDTDLIVWKSIKDKVSNEKVCTVHKEIINNKVYPNKEYFNMKDSYIFDEQWDWSVLPSNTAFIYINDNKLKDYYVNSSKEFMMNLKYSNDNIINMVFAEQRLISICAKKMNIEIKELFNLNELFNEKQSYITHIWGHKSELITNYEKRKEFCKRCIKRIINDFPEYEGVILNIDKIKKYCL